MYSTSWKLAPGSWKWPWSRCSTPRSSLLSSSWTSRSPGSWWRVLIWQWLQLSWRSGTWWERRTRRWIGRKCSSRWVSRPESSYVVCPGIEGRLASGCRRPASGPRPAPWRHEHTSRPVEEFDLLFLDFSIPWTLRKFLTKFQTCFYN